MSAQARCSFKIDWLWVLNCYKKSRTRFNSNMTGQHMYMLNRCLASDLSYSECLPVQSNTALMYVQVRTVSVNVEPIALDELQIPIPKVTEMRTVEASMRSAPDSSKAFRTGLLSPAKSTEPVQDSKQIHLHLSTCALPSAVHELFLLFCVWILPLPIRIVAIRTITSISKATAPIGASAGFQQAPAPGNLSTSGFVH